MNKYILFVSIALCFLLSTQVRLNAAAEQESARQRFSELLGQLESLQGDFVQHEYQSSIGLAPSRTLKGKFKMRRERKLAWQVIEPYTQLILSNGTHLSVYEKNIRQMVVRPLNAETLPPFFLLNDDGFKNMRIRLAGEDQFLLETADGKTDIYISFERGLPVETHWQDYSGQQIVLLFQNVVTNKKIAERNFRYKPPPGTDIIYQEW